MLVLKGAKRAVKSLAFSPDGRMLASGGAEGCVRLWDALNGKPLGVLPQTDKPDLWTEFNVLFAPDNRHLIVSSRYYKVTIWDAVERRLVRSLYPSLNPSIVSNAPCAALATDGRLLVLRWDHDLGDEAAGVFAWDSATWEPLGALWSGFDQAMALEPGGSRAVLARGPLIDTATGKLLGRWEGSNSAWVMSGPSVLAWCPKQPIIASRGGPNWINVVDLDKDQPAVRVTTSTKKHLEAFAFTPDGRHLIAVSNDKVARLYDVGTWTERQTLDFGIGGLRSVAVAPDGSRAAAGSSVSTYSGKIVIWDLD